MIDGNDRQGTCLLGKGLKEGGKSRVSRIRQVSQKTPKKKKKNSHKKCK